MTKIAEISEQERKEKKKLQRAAHYLINKERINANGKRWYAENKDIHAENGANWQARNRESVAARKAKWYADNKKEIKMRQALWYQANKEIILEKSRRYSKNHPDKSVVKTTRRRARKQNAPSENYSTKQILSLFGSVCHICLKPIDLDAPRGIGRVGWERGLHLDHVVALANGGSDLIENIRPSHALCNIKKGAA